MVPKNYSSGGKVDLTSTTPGLRKQTSTMSLLSDEFQVVLPSNVGSNPKNKPNQYETALAKPLDLPGEWDVGLIDFAYPYNWTNLVKTYQFFLLKPKSSEIVEGIDKFAPVPASDQQDLYDGIIKQKEFEGWDVNRLYPIQRGNYDIEKILEFITSISFTI